jgi:hypothetical protein
MEVDCAVGADKWHGDGEEGGKGEGIGSGCGCV